MAERRHRAIRMSIGPTQLQGRIPEQEVSRIPYEDLSELMKEAVEEALREAWRRLPAEASRQGIDLRVEGEEPITRLLRDELDKLRRDETQPVPGFTELVFQHIPESEGVPDCSGMPFKEGTKRPDLVFRPVRLPRGVVRSSTYGLFVECKIIHSSRDHHGINDYIKDGLLRFISGDYAWMMPSGMMVAYVRNGKTVPSLLIPHLSKEEHRQAYKVKRLPSLRQGSPLRAPPTYVSLHGRTPHVQPGGLSLGDIEIAHLWLDVV